MRAALLSMIILLVMAFKPGDFDIRKAYHAIPLKYLPITEGFLKGKSDNHENRDLVLIYHNEKDEFMKLRYDGSPLLGRLRMFSSEGNQYIVVEHTYCRSEKCENHFVVLRRDGESYTDVSSEVIKGFDIDIKKVRSTMKKAFKESYDDLVYFNEQNYGEDEPLRKNLIWQMDDLNGSIYLKESSLPHIIATYKWNADKARFDQQ